MTREESDENERVNRFVIGPCDHDPATDEGKRVYCRRCGCRFAVVLLPVLATFPTYEFEDDA